MTRPDLPAAVLALLAGCVAAPPPLPAPPLPAPSPIAATPGSQDPSLARDAALDGFASTIQDTSRVSEHTIGTVPVANVTLPDTVFFDFGSALPRADAAPALNSLARAIEASPPDSVLTVAGNTDAIGTARANQALSEARARAVIDALAQRGVDPRRLAAIGFGATRPIAPNDSNEDRALNRRVELALSPSFAANAASFTTVIPVKLTPATPVERIIRAHRPAALNVRPNRPDAVQRQNLGPPVSY